MLVKIKKMITIWHKEGIKMDEFEKIKTFSESLVKRQQKLDDGIKPADPEMDLPKYLSQFRAVPVQEEKESKRLLWIVVGLSLVIVVSVALILTRRLPEMEETKIIEIYPTDMPVKVRPENPGGLNIPDKDKVVYNRIAETMPSPVVENLFPEIEQPVLPSEVIEPEDKEEVVFSEPVELEQSHSVTSVTEDVIDEASAADMGSAPVESERESEVIVVPQTKPIEVQDKIEKTESVAPKTKPAGPIWRAQLLSSASKEKVESSWKTISKQQAALLSDMPYQIISATIPGKGTFWRLQVGEFATKEMVVNLCAKLKKKKQECIPVK